MYGAFFYTTRFKNVQPNILEKIAEVLNKKCNSIFDSITIEEIKYKT